MELDGTQLAQDLLEKDEFVRVIIVVHYGSPDLLNSLNNRPTNRFFRFVDRLNVFDEFLGVLNSNTLGVRQKFLTNEMATRH